jgi:DNA-directed RNA polymerase subunit RPC12/RpoP
VTTSSKSKTGFFIGVGCPGCGGELELDSDFFVIGCGHCGSVLRVLKPDMPVAYMMRSVQSESQVRFHLDRHLKKNDQLLTGASLLLKRVYYPYWKVDATMLRVRNKVEVKKFYSEYDSSAESTIERPRSEITIAPYSMTIGAGPKMPSVPDTLGIRAESIHVVPFSDENVEDGFDALPVVKPWKVVERRLKLAVGTIGTIDQPDFGNNLTRLFDPVFSLIHFPYVIVESYDPTYRRWALDGLTGRVLGAVTDLEDRKAEPARKTRGSSASFNLGGVGVSVNLGSGLSGVDDDSKEDFAERVSARSVEYDKMSQDIEQDGDVGEPPQIQFGELSVDFHRCTNCGFDLPAEMSHVYICSNCHQMRMLEDSPYGELLIEQADCDISGKATLVPFWWIKITEEQSAKLNTLLGGLGQPDKLVMPALRSFNFEAMIRLSKRMSAAITRIPTVAVESMDERFLSVRVSLTEAVALAEMMVCKEWISMGRDMSGPETRIEPTAAGLIYVPFRLENYFYVDSVINAVSMEKTLLD